MRAPEPSPPHARCRLAELTPVRVAADLELFAIFPGVWARISGGQPLPDPGTRSQPPRTRGSPKGHKSALCAVCAVVDLGSVIDVEDMHDARGFLDAVDDPVGPPAGTVAAGQGPK